MFEDDDFDLEFGDSLLEPMTILQQSNARFKPKLPSSASNTGLRGSNHPYQPPCPPTKQVLPTPTTKMSITQMSAPASDFIRDFPPKEVPSSILSQTAATVTTSIPIHNFSSPLPPPVASPGQRGEPLVRKFPGPAGLMPRLSPGIHKTAKDVTVDAVEPTDNDIECDGVINCVAWTKAMEELGLVSKDSLVQEFNTDWIKKKSQAGTTKKMPFFMCKIVRLDLTSVDPMVTLMDQEGKVEGSMHRDVVEQFGKEIRVGCVLVLQSVVVLVTARKEYVNITLNNLVAIYTKTNVKHVKRVSKEEMMVVAKELDKVREQQLKSILGGDFQQGPTQPPQSLSPAWSTPQSGIPMRRAIPRNAPSPQMRPITTSNASYNPMLKTPNPSYPISSPQPLSSVPTPVRSNFTFKSHKLPAPPPNTTQQIPSQAESQHLVASLMADLDTSDIFSDF